MRPARLPCAGSPVSAIWPSRSAGACGASIVLAALRGTTGPGRGGGAWTSSRLKPCPVVCPLRCFVLAASALMRPSRPRPVSPSCTSSLPARLVRGQACECTMFFGSGQFDFWPDCEIMCCFWACTQKLFLFCAFAWNWPAVGVPVCRCARQQKSVCVCGGGGGGGLMDKASRISKPA